MGQSWCDNPHRGGDRQNAKKQEWGEREEKQRRRKSKQKVQGHMLTRWPQLHEETLLGLYPKGHIQRGHPEPPHLRISHWEEKDWMLQLRSPRCRSFIGHSSPRREWPVSWAQVTSGEARASMHLVSSSLPPGKGLGTGHRGVGVGIVERTAEVLKLF